MIDSDMDYKYNILLSIFLGIISIVLLDQMFSKPLVITLKKI